MNNNDKKIIIAEITSPHGTKGEVNIVTFTSKPGNIKKYKPIYTEDGTVIEIAQLSVRKNKAVAKLKGIDNRDDAQKLKAKKLLVSRDTLPDNTQKDEFYVSDLIGLKTINQDGEVSGEIISVHNFGAGDIIEIKQTKDKETLFVSFNSKNVPEVNVEEGTAVVIQPNEI